MGTVHCDHNPVLDSFHLPEPPHAPAVPFCRCRRPIRYCPVRHRLSASALSVAAQTPQSRPVTQAEVDRITRDAILIDTHDDVTSKTVTGYDIATPSKGGQTDLARIKGVLGAEFFAVYVGAEYVNGNHSANRTLSMIDAVRTDIVAKHPESLSSPQPRTRSSPLTNKANSLRSWASKVAMPLKTRCVFCATIRPSASGT